MNGAGPAIPVRIIGDDELVQNGGQYLVEGRPAIPVYGIGGGGGGDTAYALVDPDAEESDSTYNTIAAALAAGHRVVMVKDGATFTGALAITQSNVTVVANGATFTAETTQPTITISGNYVRLVGGTISGSHTGASGSIAGDLTSGVGVYITGDYAHVDSMVITNTRGMAIYGDGTTHTFITRNRLTNVGINAASAKFVNNAILLQNLCTHCEVSGNEVMGWSQAVGLWYGANYNRVLSNNLINNNAYIGTTGSESTRSSCEDYGSIADPNIGNVWDANVIDGTTSSCYEGAGQLRGCRVSSNTMRNFGLGGVNNTPAGQIKVGAWGCTDSGGGEHPIGVLFEGNTVYGYGDGQVTAGCYHGNSFGVRVTNNFFYNYQPNGEGVIASHIDAGLIVQGNSFYNCGRSTYFSMGEDCQLVNNYFEGGLEDTGGEYIRLEADCEGFTISENKLWSSTATGDVALIKGDGHTVHGNKANIGRFQVTHAPNIIFTNNRISYSGGGDHALVCTGNVEGGKFMGNTFHQTNGPTVNFASAGSNVLFVNNTVLNDTNNNLIVVGGSMTKLVIDGNYLVRPDGASGISDSGSGTVIGTNYLP